MFKTFLFLLVSVRFKLSQGNVNKHPTMLVKVSFYGSSLKKVKKFIKKKKNTTKNKKLSKAEKATIKLQKKKKKLLLTEGVH